MNSQEMQSIFDSQKAAYLKDPFPSAAVRIDRMDRLIDLLFTHESALAQAIVDDFGHRPFDLARLQEITGPISALKHAKKNIKSWMKKESRKSTFPYNLLGGKSSVQQTPLGVIGNVSPWNFPVYLSLTPMAGIFAAGNRCMIKPSELTPRTSELMAKLVAEYFKPNELAVIPGGVEIATDFCGLPFDHLLFTGSTAIGSKVMQTGSKNLTPMTLELGGKSPVIVSDTANIEDVAVKLAYAKTINAGQICLAPDYVLVSEKHKDALINAVKKHALVMFPEQHNSPDRTNIISERHCTRLKSLVDEAQNDGNRIVRLFDQENTIDDPRYMEPTIIDMEGKLGKIMDEEIFGPLLPIISMNGLTEKLDFIRSKGKPLTMYYMGTDKKEMDLASTHVASGSMVTNDFYLNLAQQELPFGGVGESGTGCYQGHDGFKNFSHGKAVFRASKIDLGKMIRPPYGERFNKIVMGQLKR